MALNLKPAYDRILSLCGATAMFDAVQNHEPKSAPVKGARDCSLAVFLDWIGPAVSQSGQKSTTGRVVLIGRIYVPMVTSKPGDAELRAGLAAAKVIEVLSGDFELGGSVRCVDLMGATGTPLSAQGGYVDISNTKFRIMDVAIPLIINDIWAQEG
jgi:hypothetical protein